MRRLCGAISCWRLYSMWFIILRKTKFPIIGNRMNSTEKPSTWNIKINAKILAMNPNKTLKSWSTVS